MKECLKLFVGGCLCVDIFLRKFWTRLDMARQWSLMEPTPTWSPAQATEARNMAMKTCSSYGSYVLNLGARTLLY